MRRISRVQPVKQVYKSKQCKHDHHENFAEIFEKEKKIPREEVIAVRVRAI